MPLSGRVRKLGLDREMFDWVPSVISISTFPFNR